jgi:hypothetical protein
MQLSLRGQGGTIIPIPMKPALYRTTWLLFCIAMTCPAQWVDLLNKKNLDGWEVVGDGVWTVMKDGTLLGQRDLNNSKNQAWLYTKKEFGQFDLQLEFWYRLDANSGVSIRDTSRGRYAVGGAFDPKRTPSHIGYEIQIYNSKKDKYTTGSVYLFDKAKLGFEIPNDWNRLEIESRNDMIRVKLNGHLVSQYPGDPARSKTGPIGLQLHDQNSVVMFRNIRIREIR